MQRKRILDAVVEVVAERGVADASVALAIARAGVSRRAFYEQFAGLEECLIAVLDGALERATPIVVGAFGDSTPTPPWYEGVRRALAAMLDFFDEEPALARVCMVELGAGTPVVREHRERILAAFAGMILTRIEREVSHPSPLAAEGIYASVVGIVNARLSGPEQPPLLELLGPLMGVLVGAFMDQAAVAREIERGNTLAAKMLSARTRARSSEQGREHADAEIPAPLRDPRAHRVRQCLRYVADWTPARGEPVSRGPVGPSNREVGAAIGVEHRGQVAALLAQLLRLNLLSKHAGRPGAPNAWRATPEGQRVAHALQETPQRYGKGG